MLIPSLKKAFRAYAHQPFLFVWGMIVYLMLNVLFEFGALGLFIMYFLGASVAQVPVTLDNRLTLAGVGIAILTLMFFLSGLNAGLMRAYANSLDGRRTSIRELFEYSLDKSAMLFAIMVIRDAITLVFVGPVVAVWWLYLKDVVYSEVFTALYAICAIFLIHMAFSGAMLSAGAIGTSFMQSMRNGIGLLRKKHVFFIMLYAVFALTWVLSFVPFVQLATLFVAYPVAYSAMILMVQNLYGIRTDRGTRGH